MGLDSFEKEKKKKERKKKIHCIDGVGGFEVCDFLGKGGINYKNIDRRPSTVDCS